jgi:hypothetical protein
MEESNPLQALKRALCLYEGVLIEEIASLPDKTMITVRITDAESIVWLQYFCLGANVACSVYAIEKPNTGEPVEASLARLRWRFVFSGKQDGKKGDEQSDLQIFGEWAIDYLLSMGRVDAANAVNLKNMLYGK